jgi:hypothetical protein
VANSIIVQAPSVNVGAPAEKIHCDMVLKGGITSGNVIYWHFAHQKAPTASRNIEGTSAGAIAASDSSGSGL